jgi:hypothetical protein
MASPTRWTRFCSSADSSSSISSLLDDHQLAEQLAEAGADAAGVVLQPGIEITRGRQVLGHVAGPLLDRALHVLALPPGRLRGHARDQDQLGRAVLGDRVGHGDRGVAEQVAQRLGLGEQGRAPGGREHAEPLLPGKALGHGLGRGEPPRPGVQPVEQLAPQIRHPPLQRRVALAVLEQVELDRVGHGHGAVGEEPEPHALLDRRIEAAGEKEQATGQGKPPCTRDHGW